MNKKTLLLLCFHPTVIWILNVLLKCGQKANKTRKYRLIVFLSTGLERINQGTQSVIVDATLGCDKQEVEVAN